MQVESSSIKKTFFDPTIVVDESGASVQVGLKRSFLIETNEDGSASRTNGEQWLVLKSKELVWEDATTTGSAKYMLSLPADVWKAIQAFLINYQS